TKRPGKYRIAESEKHKDIGEAIYEIGAWCELVKRDLYASLPAVSEIKAAQARLEEEIKKHITNPDAHFSPEEIEQFSQRFDRITKEVEQLKSDNKITEEELRKLKEEIQDMKRAAEALPKGKFARICANRLAAWAKFAAPVIQKLAIGEGRKLLGLPE
ncbi:MAG TPA: hypothetical protein VGP21_03640, partial [Opitutaceae bacterium]|nr:hypothetical protein [Opitutaceae bacterium]